MISYGRVAENPGVSNVTKSQIADEIGAPSGVDTVVEFDVPKRNLVIDDHNDVNLRNPYDLKDRNVTTFEVPEN